MTNVQAGAAPCSSKFVRQPARELAEALTLPPGVHGQIVADDAVPQNVSEARVLHTCLTRSLGRRYRERWAWCLRADRSGIVLAQAGLRARLPVRAITRAPKTRGLCSSTAPSRAENLRADVRRRVRDRTSRPASWALGR